jgi:hypothetical protein
MEIRHRVFNEEQEEITITQGDASAIVYKCGDSVSADFDPMAYLYEVNGSTFTISLERKQDLVDMLAVLNEVSKHLKD